MAVKTIITEPNKLLRQISKPVESVGKEEQQLMNDMLDTMYDANGIGLAAIQIGIPKRIIVMDIAKDGKKEPRYFVNPVILNKDPIKNTHEEGCLSVPEQFAEIDRPSKCDVEYLDYNGKKQLLKAEGNKYVPLECPSLHFLFYLTNLLVDYELFVHAALNKQNDMQFYILLIVF